MASLEYFTYYQKFFFFFVGLTLLPSEEPIVDNVRMSEIWTNLEFFIQITEDFYL